MLKRYHKNKQRIRSTTNKRIKGIYERAAWLRDDIKANVVVFIHYPIKKVKTTRAMAFGKLAIKMYFSKEGQKFADKWEALDNVTGWF